MAISGDSCWLACGGPSENIFSMAGEFKPGVLLFDWKTGELKKELKPDDESWQGNICGLAFHPGGFLVAVGGGKSGGRIWLWDIDTERVTPFSTVELPTAARDFDLHAASSRMTVALYDGQAVRNVTEDVGGVLQVYTVR